MSLAATGCQVSGQSRLRIVPCTLTRAHGLVELWHRHHKPSTGAIFAVAVADDEGRVRGVALVGRPVARMLDDGWTLEVNRVATDGCPNACSALYGAAQRMAKALGYSRLLTYIRDDEPGTSTRAAGLLDDGPIRARSWNMPGRPRTDKTEIVQRRRFVARPTGPDPIDLTWPEDANADQLTIEAAL